MLPAIQMELVWKALIGEGQGEGDRTDKRDEVSEGLDEGVKNRQESSSSNLGRFRCQQLLLRAMLQARCTASSSSSSSSSSMLPDNTMDPPVQPVAPPTATAAQSQSPLPGKRSLQAEVCHRFLT